MRVKVVDARAKGRACRGERAGAADEEEVDCAVGRRRTCVGWMAVGEGCKRQVIVGGGWEEERWRGSAKMEVD